MYSLPTAGWWHVFKLKVAAKTDGFSSRKCPFLAPLGRYASLRCLTLELPSLASPWTSGSLKSQKPRRWKVIWCHAAHFSLSMSRKMLGWLEISGKNSLIFPFVCRRVVELLMELIEILFSGHSLYKTLAFASLLHMLELCAVPTSFKTSSCLQR